MRVRFGSCDVLGESDIAPERGRRGRPATALAPPPRLARRHQIAIRLASDRLSRPPTRCLLASRDEPTASDDAFSPVPEGRIRATTGDDLSSRP